jgi:hypothetical protein
MSERREDHFRDKLDIRDVSIYVPKTERTNLKVHIAFVSDDFFFTSCSLYGTDVNILEGKITDKGIITLA